MLVKIEKNKFANKKSLTAKMLRASEGRRKQEADTWIQSKLNTEWIHERSTSQLNEDLLSHFVDASHFANLDSTHKIRLLLSCLAIRKKQTTELAPFFAKIIDV